MTLAALKEFDGNSMDGLEFCSQVYSLFETIRRAVDGPSRLRMRPTRVEKRLLEELLPIARYIQASYRPGRYISVCWVDGSQTYDAKISQYGAYVCENYYPEFAHLEVTCAAHRNEYLSRELLEKKGVAFGLEGIKRMPSGEIESTPVGYSNRDFVDSYAKIVQEQIAKKASKRYPVNTTLIVQCVLNSIYMPDEWDDLMRQLRDSTSASPFREIYLYDPVQQYSHSFFQQNDTLGS